MSEKNYQKRETKLQLFKSKFGGLRAKFIDGEPTEMTMPEMTTSKNRPPVYRQVDSSGNEVNIALADGTVIEFKGTDLYDQRTWFEDG